MARLRTSIIEKDITDIPVSNASRALRPASVEDLTTMIWQTLKVLDKDINFVSAYPDYLLYDDTIAQKEAAPQVNRKTITWYVVRQEPGSLGSERFGGPKEWKPRVREELIRDNSYLVPPSGGYDHGVQTYGQIFESIIQFDCFSQTNFEAERLINFFKDTMTLHIPTYIKYGVKNMHIWRRLRDEYLTRFRNGFLTRSIQYYVVTEEVTVINVPLIKRIDIEVAAEVPRNRLYSDPSE